MKFEEYLNESNLGKSEVETILKNKEWKVARKGFLESGNYQVHLSQSTVTKSTKRIRDPSKTVMNASFTLRQGGLPVFTMEKKLKGESQANTTAHEANIKSISDWVGGLTGLSIKRTDFS